MARRHGTVGPLNVTCPACGQSPHPLMRVERLFAAAFNGIFAALEVITFARH